MTVFNVQDFGAKGDGKTDDTKAIQMALDAAYKAGGGTVYIPAGEYRVKGDGDAGHGALLVRSNVSVEGDGMGMTTIKLIDNYNKKLTGIIRTPTSEVTNNVTIKDLTIDGNMAKNKGEVDGFFTGVKPDDPRASDNITVDRVEIMNCSRYGFDPHERVTNLNIHDGIAHDNGSDGVVYDMIIGGKLDNMIAYDNGRYGLNIVTSSRNITAENNISFGNGYIGLVVQRGSDHTTWSGDVTVKGGAFYENGEHGIAVKISDHVTVADTNVFLNTKSGVRIGGSTQVEMYGNTVRNNSQIGEGKYAEVQVNSFDDREGITGLNLVADDVKIHDNLLYGGGTTKASYGVGVDGSGGTHVNVYNNKVFGTLKGDASMGSSSTNTFTAYNGKIIGLAGSLLSGNLTSANKTDGTDSADLLTGGTKGDTLSGKGGNDSIYGEYGSDKLYGGDGNDFIAGDSGNDTIEGGDGNNTLLGGKGNDVIIGGANNDTMVGDDGKDTMDGGAGDDKVFGGSGDNNLKGGDGNDTVVGDGGKETIDGGNGDDLILAFSGNDSVTGGQGDDSINGGTGNDTIDGGDGDDIVVGAEGNDVIKGSGGNDNLLGGRGADKLDGGAGADTINGGSWFFSSSSGTGIADVLTGGDGRDTFIFDSGFGQATITDFSHGEDVIRLAKSTASSVSAALSSVTYSDGNAVVTLGSNVITLQGVADGTLTASDFIVY